MCATPLGGGRDPILVGLVNDPATELAVGVTKPEWIESHSPLHQSLPDSPRINECCIRWSGRPHVSRARLVQTGASTLITRLEWLQVNKVRRPVEGASTMSPMAQLRQVVGLLALLTHRLALRPLSWASRASTHWRAPIRRARRRTRSRVGARNRRSRHLALRSRHRS